MPKRRGIAIQQEDNSDELMADILRAGWNTINPIPALSAEYPVPPPIENMGSYVDLLATGEAAYKGRKNEAAVKRHNEFVDKAGKEYLKKRTAREIGMDLKKNGLNAFKYPNQRVPMFGPLSGVAIPTAFIYELIQQRQDNLKSSSGGQMRRNKK